MEEVKAKESVKTYRSFTVRPCLNGFIVEIGCQLAVFNKEDDLIDAIAKYIRNPSTTEEKFLSSTKVLAVLPIREDGVQIRY